MNKIIKILTIFILGLGISISSYSYDRFKHLNNANAQNTNYDDVQWTGHDGVQFPIKIKVEYECELKDRHNSFTPIGEHYIEITSFRDRIKLVVKQISHRYMDSDTIRYIFPTIVINSEQYYGFKNDGSLQLNINVYEEDMFWDDNPITNCGTKGKSSTNNFLAGKGIKCSTSFSEIHTVLTDEEKCTLTLSRK